MSEDDEDPGVARRDLLRGVGAGVGAAALAAAAAAQRGDHPSRESAGDTDPRTADTFAALVDAILPRTPELSTLGPEHVPGGLAIDLDGFLVTYVNTLFQHGARGVGHLGDLRLSEVLADVLDASAAELVARGLNEHEPGDRAPEGEDWSSGGPFARLHRSDRIRAIALLDEEDKDWNSAAFPGPVAEGDAGLFAQLAVSFTEVVYYSEWQGYDDFTAAPGDREFSGPDPHDTERPCEPAATDETDPAIQSWCQTGFPGNAEGYQALRGYAGKPGTTLGGDDADSGSPDVWKIIETHEGEAGEDDGTDERLSENEDGTRVLVVTAEQIPLSGHGGSDKSRTALRITREPGHFRENTDYGGGYEEVYPEEDEPTVEVSADVEASHGPVEATVEVNASVDEDDVGSGLRRSLRGS